MTREPKQYEVLPRVAGSEWKPCSCGAEITFVETEKLHSKTGRPVFVPVAREDCDVGLDGILRGPSHFTTCPHADKHRRPRG